jgi:FAD/FMN-containing dehydrogenase
VTVRQFSGLALLLLALPARAEVLTLPGPEGVALPEFLARVHAFDDETYAQVQAHGGSISAEHGVGLLKREHLHYSRSPEELAIFRGIKAALDPQGLFNRGKIF